MHPQLTLSFDSSSLNTFDSFYISKANTVAVAAIHTMALHTSAESQIFIHGPSACGKTHLAMAACSAAKTSGFRAAYLPGELVRQADALTGLEQFDLVCIDQFESISREAEDAWFHCINRARESSTQLIFFSICSTQTLPIKLNDLRTRLNWGAVFQLSGILDSELEPAMVQMFEARGMTASEEVVRYILNRHQRDIAALTELLDAIGLATLSQGRALSVPIVREVLSGYGA